MLGSTSGDTARSVRMATRVVGALAANDDDPPKSNGAEVKNSETDDFVGCIGTVRVLFMG